MFARCVLTILFCEREVQLSFLTEFWVVEVLCLGIAAGVMVVVGAIIVLVSKAAFHVRAVCLAVRGSVLIIAYMPLPSI